MTNKIALAAAIVAASCCVLFAGETEQKAFKDLSLTGVESGIEIPAPQAAASEGQPSDRELDAFFEYFGGMIKAPEALPVMAGGKAVTDVSEGNRGPIVYSIELEPIRNGFLYSGVTFKTSKGTAVHLSGHKATDCPKGGTDCAMKEKIFLVLTTQRGESYLIRGMDVANFSIFMSGSKTIEIDGEKFTVKLHASVSKPETSRIEVTSNGRKVLSVTAVAMGDALAKKGVAVKLSRDYKLAYGNELVQAGGARFTDKKLVLLIPFPMQDANSYFLLNASDMKPSGVLYPEIDAKFGFRIENGTLDIFSVK